MSVIPNGYEQVGIDYCLVHLGTRNEDESGACSWAHRDEEPQRNGEPRPCHLVPLLYATFSCNHFWFTPQPANGQVGIPRGTPCQVCGEPYQPPTTVNLTLVQEPENARSEADG